MLAKAFSVAGLVMDIIGFVIVAREVSLSHRRELLLFHGELDDHLRKADGLDAQKGARLSQIAEARRQARILFALSKRLGFAAFLLELSARLDHRRDTREAQSLRRAHALATTPSDRYLLQRRLLLIGGGALVTLGFAFQILGVLMS